MKKVMILGIIASLALLLSPVTAFSNPAGPPGGMDVKIVDQPVEVKGKVDAVISGEVDVINTPNVNVVNIPEVEVINVKEPIVLGAQIYMTGDRYADGENLQESGTTDVFVVPDNKQLVIEYVSMETAGFLLSPGQNYQGFISVDGYSRFLVGTVRGDQDVTQFGPDSGQMVKLRVKPGSKVFFAIFSTVNGMVNVDVSGYLETIN